MSETPANDVSLVGNRFVFRYYTALHEKPTDLQHFYRDNSSFTHGYEDGSDGVTVVGFENIGKKIKALDFQDCKVTLSVVDCQKSLNGGILITVIGFLSNKGEEPKKFVETFFLAVQTEPAGYYVLNDIFRYVQDVAEQTSELSNDVAEHHPVHEATASEVKEEKVNPPTSVSPADHKEKPAPATTSSSTATPAADTAAPATQNHKQSAPKKEEGATQQQQQPPRKPEEKPQQQQQQATKPAPQQQQQQQKTGQPPVKATATAAAAPSKPANWAAVVRSSDANNTTTTTTATATAASTNNNNNNADDHHGQPQQQQPSTQQQGAVKNTKEQQPQKSPNPRLSPALYVNNLPFDIPEADVRATFARFGEIKYLELRGPKGFCFIEYTDPTIVPQTIAACKVSPISLGGRPLSVEERKPKSGKKDINKDKKPRGNRETGKEKRAGSPSPQQQQQSNNNKPFTPSSQPKREKTENKPSQPQQQRPNNPSKH